MPNLVYEIKNGDDIDGDLKWLSVRERAVIKKALPKYLRVNPTRRSSHRKELDPNQFEAPWELRLGALRVLYEVDEANSIVWALRTGREPADILYIRGVAYDLRDRV